MTNININKLIYSVNIAILLTCLNGCALLLKKDQKNDYDPIARAALLQDYYPSSPSTFSNDSQPVGVISEQDYLLEQHRLHQEEEIQKGLEAGELVLGMSMNQVMAIWGRPRDVETAGDSYQGNQKWIYLDSISKNFTLGISRVVYFESGRVIGWETSR